MTRIALIEQADAPLLAKPFYAGGDPGVIAKALATVPELMGPALGFFGAVLGPSALAPRPKEIVVLRTSAVLECQYCIASHTVVALDTGLSHAEVSALRASKPIDACFTNPDELALIAYIDAVAGAKGAVPDAVAATLARHWPEHLVVEITTCIATTMLLNRFCTALELPSSPDTIARLTAEGFQ